MVRLVVAFALAAAVALLAAWLQRRRPGAGPAPTRHHVPTLVDRGDFDRPGAPWLVVVFTSATCSSCAAVLAAARPLASGDVVIEEAEVVGRADLHRRYGIDAVPTTVVVDRSGAVRRHFLGPVTADQLRDALTELE